MHQEIVAVHNAGEKSVRHFASGVHFIHPIEPCLGAYAGKPFQVACRGEFDNAAALRQQAGVTNFHSMLHAEIIVHLLKRRERELPLLPALVDVLNEVRGTYALVLIWGETLLASRCGTGKQSLFTGMCDGVLLVASEPGLFSTHGAAVEQELPVGEVFCQIANRLPIWATPSRPIHMRVGREVH